MDAIEKYLALAGADAHETGVLVCRADKITPMPSNNLAVPRQAFPEWLLSRV